jgi:hypothetical protein
MQCTAGVLCRPMLRHQALLMPRMRIKWRRCYLMRMTAKKRGAMPFTWSGQRRSALIRSCWLGVKTPREGRSTHYTSRCLSVSQSAHMTHSCLCAVCTQQNHCSYVLLLLLLLVLMLLVLVVLLLLPQIVVVQQQ